MKYSSVSNIEIIKINWLNLKFAKKKSINKKDIDMHGSIICVIR